MSKKSPQRMCLACREMKDKNQLLRVVKSAQGEVQIDLQGKLPGRGAYLCKEENCLQKIQKNRGLERGLSSKMPEKLYENLSTILQANKEEET